MLHLNKIKYYNKIKKKKNNNFFLKCKDKSAIKFLNNKY